VQIYQSYEEAAMHRLALSFALVLLPAFHLDAGVAEPSDPATQSAERPEQQKRPWEWTLEDRLVARVNPVKIAERQDTEEARYHSAGAQAPSTERETTQSYSIEGSRNPELLLPHELFQSLLTGFVPDDERRRNKRESLRPGIVASGFDEELFWAHLRSAAGEFIDDYAYPVRETAISLSEPRQYGLCRGAFTALNNARQIFGPDRFDRFLYEVVAPGTWVGSATNAPDPAAELRYVERGCP
jgi:hypothetical protein